MHGNEFTGIIPAQSLNNMTSLTDISLDNNRFIGEMPHLPDLESLVSLNVANNQLIGPFRLSVHRYLKYIDISFNWNIYGSIPIELTECINLESVVLNNNHLDGSFPAAIGNLNQMRNFILSNNDFSGELPSSITN